MVQNYDVPLAMNRVSSQSSNELAIDEDVEAEAAKICAGNADENSPIILQNLTKTFVDASSGLEIKAVQGVSFQVPVSQVPTARLTSRAVHHLLYFMTQNYGSTHQTLHQ